MIIQIFCTKCKRYLDISSFNKDNNRKNGLQIWCRNCQKSYDKVYSKTNIGRKSNIDSTNKWVRSNKEYHKEYQCQYHKCNRTSINNNARRYRKTIKGNYISKKDISNRKRNMGWIPLVENPFSENIEIEWHHIDDKYVIPVPKELHRVTCGYQNHKCLCYQLFSKYLLFHYRRQM